jgi:hypothetical protein
MEVLQTELGQIEIHRKAGRRRLTLVMHPWQPLQIRANQKTTISEIKTFLLEKKGWIEKNLKNFENHRAAFPVQKFGHGESFPLLGDDRFLSFELNTWPQYSAQFRKNQLVIYVPSIHYTPNFLRDSHPELKPLIRDLYKKVAIFHLTQRVDAISKLMGLTPSELKFNESKTLWGSCSPSGVVRLNWKVIVFKPEVIDYLIIHELAHLQHLNHSQKFWNLVEKYCPKYREFKSTLKMEHSKARFLNKHKTGDI